MTNEKDGYILPFTHLTETRVTFFLPPLLLDLYNRLLLHTLCIQMILTIPSIKQDRMAIDAEEAGMDAFMDKPFKLEELTAVYIKLLERDHRNQCDRSIRTTTLTPGVDTDTVARGPRSLCNVTKNAKIFVDVDELHDMIASQIDTTIVSLGMEQDGTSPTVAVAIPERQSPMNTQKITVRDSDRGNEMIKEIKYNNSKVHPAN